MLALPLVFAWVPGTFKDYAKRALSNLLANSKMGTNDTIVAAGGLGVMCRGGSDYMRGCHC
jgi:hypothetical protein